MTNDREHLLQAAGLRVRFVFRADRFAHEVQVANGAEWRTVARSREGSPADAWPASPPFQSMHVESRAGDRQLALLVGMAGRSHWSASVDLDPHTGSLTFDMACRVRAAECGWLGSSYLAIYSQRAVDTRHAVFANDETPNLGIDLAICDGSEACLAADAEGVTISPAEMSATGHHTVRWAYRISRRGSIA